eukprot:CAMPEP_0118922700 /NCGR_PEP_ID=MMETSP1169-20130426/1541_1 /TAXON_ID=36882 /ORGANISM="Pyramimonas obovata, Strain CCMP722" /LENGTH=205 /DNA_ID=CAMNT_0006863615 /DNA_START=58 /DNA_END=671 /DNA_ORIENTATION=-
MMMELSSSSLLRLNSSRSAFRTPTGRARSMVVVARTVKPDISLADVKQGPKIGSGNFGDVYEGAVKGQRVILKAKKTANSDRADRFFNAELGICRRLKGCSGVPDFMGVAGADVYLVWKYEGTRTLEDFLKSRNCLGDLASELGVRGDKAAVKALAKRLLESIRAIHKAGCVHRDVKPDNVLIAKGGGGVFGGGGKAKVKMIDLG